MKKNKRTIFDNQVCCYMDTDFPWVFSLNYLTEVCHTCDSQSPDPNGDKWLNQYVLNTYHCWNSHEMAHHSKDYNGSITLSLSPIISASRFKYTLEMPLQMYLAIFGFIALLIFPCCGYKLCIIIIIIMKF